AEPEPRPDGPGRGDLAARPALAGGARPSSTPSGDRQRRRSAGGLGGRGRAPGDVGVRGPALARRLLVLPELRCAPAPGRRRLALPGVLLPAAAGPLDALR